MRPLSLSAILLLACATSSRSLYRGSSVGSIHSVSSGSAELTHETAPLDEMDPRPGDLQEHQLPKSVDNYIIATGDHKEGRGGRILWFGSPGASEILEKFKDRTGQVWYRRSGHRQQSQARRPLVPRPSLSSQGSIDRARSNQHDKQSGGMFCETGSSSQHSGSKGPDIHRCSETAESLKKLTLNPFEEDNAESPKSDKKSTRSKKGPNLGSASGPARGRRSRRRNRPDDADQPQESDEQSSPAISIHRSS